MDHEEHEGVFFSVFSVSPCEIDLRTEGASGCLWRAASAGDEAGREWSDAPRVGDVREEFHTENTEDTEKRR
jgi:hypothetical protein